MKLENSPLQIGSHRGQNVLSKVLSLVLGDFIPSAINVTNGRTPIFVSREGYWLSAWWSQIDSDVSLRNWFPISRTGVLRLLVLMDDDVVYRCSRGYEGSLFNCLISRFGFDLHELAELGKNNSFIELLSCQCSVLDRTAAATVTSRVRDVLRLKLNSELERLESWLNLIEPDPSQRIYVDLGYSGTISSGLSDLLGTPSPSYFWCATDEAIQRGYKARWGPEKWGASSLLQNSIFIELLLRAPVGKFRAMSTDFRRISYYTSSEPRPDYHETHIREMHRTAIASAQFETLEIEVIRHVLADLAEYFRCLPAHAMKSWMEPDDWMSDTGRYQYKKFSS